MIKSHNNLTITFTSLKFEEKTTTKLNLPKDRIVLLYLLHQLWYILIHGITENKEKIQTQKKQIL